MKRTISIQLFDLLQRGKEQLSREALQRVVAFVESQRTDAESFRDKSGKADLYYTLFGWMLSIVLGIKLHTGRMKTYLEKQDVESFDLIHYAAYRRLQMIRQLMAGGKIGLFASSLFPTAPKELQAFAEVPHNDRQSPYSQFLWLSLLEDTGRKPIAADFDLSPYQVESGGYRNTVDGLTATTNATAAALAIKGQLEGYKTNPDVAFLRELQDPSGGFAAAEASPLPDLLSTATSLFVLNGYGVKPKYPIQDFIEAHWLDSGGFSATLLEDKSDVEYTFYGLLALGAIDN